MRDHPVIEQMERCGYMVEENECAGSDYFGDEIRSEDDIVKFDGEIILECNLRRYLEEEMGFEFTTA
ncbi:YqaI family protein [Peribacillus acanthi]|uniref:YqaI family protein n=1 Tax=Peribacillus acanthi TaxID=2171554 RepID=UPI000D3E81DB|nr:hypothetical protein [Peribacillus acanthi]